VGQTRRLAAIIAADVAPAGSPCTIWDGRRDRIHFFELRLVELPRLQLDNREVIEARLTSPIELQSMVFTKLVATYLARLRVCIASADPCGRPVRAVALPYRDQRQLRLS